MIWIAIENFSFLLYPGEFGIVYKAHLVGAGRRISSDHGHSGGVPTAVAVKTLKGIANKPAVCMHIATNTVSSIDYQLQAVAWKRVIHHQKLVAPIKCIARLYCTKQ